MVKAILSALILTVVSSQSFASAMSVERSRCLALETHHKAHSTWKLTFRDFQMNPNLTEQQRFEVSMGAAPKVLARLQNIQKITRKENQNHALISETMRFLKAMEDDGIYTKSFAVKLMSHALPKFEDAIDSAIFHGEIENNCLNDVMNERSATSSPRSAQ